MIETRSVNEPLLSCDGRRLRKVIQGTRFEGGLENHTVLRSLFETARRQGKKAQDFFYNLFTLPTAQAQASLYRNPLPNKEHGAVLQC